MTKRRCCSSKRTFHIYKLVRRSGLLLRNFWLKKLPRHKWPSQLTHSLAEFFCEKDPETLSKILLKITLLYSTPHQKKILLKDTICKITLKTYELSIPELELESLFYNGCDEKPRRAVLASVLD